MDILLLRSLNFREDIEIYGAMFSVGMENIDPRTNKEIVILKFDDEGENHFEKKN